MLAICDDWRPGVHMVPEEVAGFSGLREGHMHHPSVRVVPHGCVVAHTRALVRSPLPCHCGHWFVWHISWLPE